MFYEYGAIQAQRVLGLTKDAGVRDALRTLFTGRVPLYHGTSAGRAQKILTEGLRPQGAKGVSAHLSEKLKEIGGIRGFSDAERGLAFTTRRPASARTYATQQTGLERLQRAQSTVKPLYERLPEKMRTDFEFKFKSPEALPIERSIELMLGQLPGGKRVLQANVPRRTLRQIEDIGQELHRNPAIREARGVLKAKDPRLEQVAALPFTSDVPVRGGIAAQFFKKSPQYRGVSREELRAHLRDVVQEPKAVAKDVLRSLIERSHRPSTLIEQGKLL